MSALSIQVPFPVFQGRDGQPLENGYVWIGEPNLNPQTNPVVAYYDKALTIVAAQPLRTLNGFISRAGTPAQVYIDGVDFSILVQDSKGSMVYNFPDGTGIGAQASGVSFTGFKGQVGTVQNLAGNTGSDWIGFAQSGTGADPISAQDKMRQIVHVADFGAVGDSSTDDTTAIQTAIDYVQAASSGQIELHFDAKKYRIVGTLNITGPVRLVGQGAFDLDNARPITLPGKGTWLIHANTAGPLIQVSGSLNKGAGLFDIAIFQEGHATPGPGWSPTVRDWVIRNENTQGTLFLNRVHFHNVYQGVLTDFSARFQYENITGQFFYRGFSFDRIYDIGKFDGLHAWTYWSEADSVLQWQQANCVEITFYRVDGMWMDRIFTFAVSSTLFFDESVYGSAQVIEIGSLYSDFCGRAIVVDATNPVHVQVANMFHLGQAWPPALPANVIAGAAALDISSGSNHLVQIGNVYDTLAASHAIRINGTFNTVWIGSGIFSQYSRGGAGQGAATVAATNTLRFGSVPLLNPYAGGATTLFNGTPGGTAFEQTRQIITTAAVNYPVTGGSAAGQLAIYTVEGEAAAGVALLALTTGIVLVGSATNALSFYGGASAVKGAITGAKGGNVALANLITYLANRGLLTDSTT